MRSSRQDWPQYRSPALLSTRAAVRGRPQLIAAVTSQAVQRDNRRGIASVVMPTGAVYMAVTHLLSGGSANVDDLDLKVEGLASEGMIGIDSHFRIAQLYYCNNHGVIVGLGLQLHADG